MLFIESLQMYVWVLILMFKGSKETVCQEEKLMLILGVIENYAYLSRN